MARCYALLTVFLCVLLPCSAVTGLAANLQISPVMIEFAAGQRSSEIRLGNSGDTVLYGQVRVYKWTQENGQDQLVATSDLVASPPLIQIAPASEQVIRLVQTAELSQQKNAEAEQTYRILIDEIPVENPDTSGVNIALRYSVPVFIFSLESAQVTPPRLRWTLHRRVAEHGWLLAVQNQGAMRAQLGATVLIDSEGQRYELTAGLFGYALAGSTRIWTLATLPDNLPGHTLKAQSRINAALVSQTVVILPSDPAR